MSTDMTSHLYYVQALKGLETQMGENVFKTRLRKMLVHSPLRLCESPHWKIQRWHFQTLQKERTKRDTKNSSRLFTLSMHWPPFVPSHYSSNERNPPEWCQHPHLNPQISLMWNTSRAFNCFHKWLPVDLQFLHSPWFLLLYNCKSNMFICFIF